jgi:hypothetical protein
MLICVDIDRLEVSLSEFKLMRWSVECGGGGNNGGGAGVRVSVDKGGGDKRCVCGFRGDPLFIYFDKYDLERAFIFYFGICYLVGKSFYFGYFYKF